MRTNQINSGCALSREGTNMYEAKGKYLEPGIWRLTTNRYRLDVHVGPGLPRRRPVITGDIHFARAERDRLHKEIIAQKSDRSLTFRIVKDVLEFYVETKYKFSARYRRRFGPMLISHLKTSLGPLPFTRKGQEPRKGDLTVDDIEQFLLRRQSEVIADNKKCAESYLDIYIVTLKAAFHHCKIECPAIEDLPHRKIKKQKKESIPDSALKVFRESLPRSVLAVMLYKEMVPSRCLELYDLEVSQIDLANRKIPLRADQTKNDEARDLPIPAMLLDYFTWIVSSGSPWVFPRITVRKKTGELVFHKLRANYVAEQWRSVRRAANLPESIKFRLLRHSTVSRYLQQGIDGGIVADIMGASEETMRTFYQVVPIEVKNSAADLVNHGHPLDTLNKILPFREKREVISA